MNNISDVPQEVLDVGRNIFGEVSLEKLSRIVDEDSVPRVAQQPYSNQVIPMVSNIYNLMPSPVPTPYQPPARPFVPSYYRQENNSLYFQTFFEEVGKSYDNALIQKVKLPDKNLRIIREFDDNFLKVMGNNSKNIMYLSENIINAFLLSLCEWKIEEALSSDLRLYPKLKEFIEVIQRCHYFFQKRGEHYAWFTRLNDTVEYHSTAELLKHIFNLRHFDILKVFLYLTGTHRSSLEMYTTTVHPEDSIGSSEVYDLYPSFLRTENHTFVLNQEQQYDIVGNFGQILGRYLIYDYYKNHRLESSFCIEATTRHRSLYKFLEIGSVLPRATFFNAHLLDNFLDSYVLLFGDIRSAIVLQNELDKCKNLPEDIIISGWLGLNFDKLPWDVFRDKKVIFVPAPDITSIAMSKAVGEKLKNICESFSVCPSFVLHTQIDKDNPPAMPKFEGNLIESAYIIEEQQPVFLIKRIVKDALPYEKFYRKWHDAGYIAFGNEPIGATQTQPPIVVKPVSLSPESIQDAFAQKEAEVSYWESLINQRFLTVIVGDSNAGKGYFAYTLALGLATATPVFGMMVKSRKKVMYLDFEGYEKDTQVKSQRIISAYNLDCAVVERNFNIFSKDVFSDTLKMDITQDCFKNLITETCKSNGYDVFIVDNLISSSPKKMTTERAITDCYDFFTELSKECGVAVVLCHHTGKANGGESDTLGTSFIESKAQNVFLLHGRVSLEKLLKDKKNITESEEMVLDSLSEYKGCLFRLTVRKCKEFCKFDREGVYWRLLLNNENKTDGKWQLLQKGKWVEDSESLFDDEVKDEILSLPEKAEEIDEEISAFQSIEDNAGMPAQRENAPDHYMSYREKLIYNIVLKAKVGIEKDDIQESYNEYIKNGNRQREKELTEATFQVAMRTLKENEYITTGKNNRIYTPTDKRDTPFEI